MHLVVRRLCPLRN